ncbi:endonuclease domain-containing protein [Homoserinimonas sp. A520]
MRVVTVHDLRVTSVLDTWCELSTVLTVQELVIAGDRLLARSDPLCTIQELRSAVRAFASRRGVRKLREALELIRPRVDSPKETELRLLLVHAGLPEPEINVPIINRFGAQIGIGDMVYSEFRTIVEYDGQQHRTDDQQYETDSDRIYEIIEEGWRIIRVLKGQLRYRPAMVLNRVRTALIHGGWNPETAVLARKR